MGRRVVIIGGGLAGMTVAKELRHRGMQVVILEATESLGGKAGAKIRHGHSQVEHGYHVFPLWYRNTRRLLRELSLEKNLVDIRQSHYLKKLQPGQIFATDEFPPYATFYELSSLRNWYRTFFGGIRPWPEMILSYFYYADLASQRVTSRTQRVFLDRISASGFLYKRAYATEGVVEFNQQQTLQATSTPIYEMSAMTLRNVVQYWAKYRNPFLSIMKGNLQDTFIAPFAQHLQQHDVGIQYNATVSRLQVTNHRVSGVKLAEGGEFAGISAEDIFVLATPQEVTFRFYDDAIAAAEQSPTARSQARSLTDLAHLRSVPMASLTLYLNRRILGMPKEHIFLDRSSLKISFIDISQQWEELNPEPGHTVLSLIVANFSALQSLSSAAVAEHIIAELLSYIPTIQREDIARWYLEPNLNAPLFLNTVGAWHYRPDTRTRIDNVYITGDYCRTDADLTTMESAVISALATANAILQDHNMDANVSILPLETYPRLLFVALKVLLFPFMLILRLLIQLKLVPHTPQSPHS